MEPTDAEVTAIFHCLTDAMQAYIVAQAPNLVSMTACLFAAYRFVEALEALDAERAP